jgi:hypothetical protein
MKGDRKSRQKVLSRAAQEFLDVLRGAPPVAELPWMRVEIVGESSKTYVFALAVHDGWVVGGAPIARMMIGQRARDVWKMYKRRGAALSRLEPHERRPAELTTVSRRDFWPS